MLSNQLIGAVFLVLSALLSCSFSWAQEAPKCEVCSWPAPVTDNPLSRQIECDDFYLAACLDEKGDLRYRGKETDGTPDVKAFEERLTTFRNQAAVAAGAKDYLDLLILQLNANSLETKKELKPELKEGLAKNRMTWVLDSDLKEIFVAYSVCQNQMDATSIAIEEVITKGSEENINDRVQENRLLIEHKHKEMKKYLAQNIPILFDKLSNKCQALSPTPPEKPTVEDATVRKICEKKQDIRIDAIEAYRSAGTPQGEKLAQDFVDKYFPVVSHFEKPDTGRSILYDQKYFLRDKVCEPLKDSLLLQGKKVLADVAKKIASSQIVVESVIKSVYTPQRKKSLKKIYKLAVREVLAFVEERGFRAEEVAKIRSDFAAVELSWTKVPRSDFYVKDPLLGISVLPEMNPSTQLLFESSDNYEAFEEPDLSYFTAYNASYAPKITFGQKTRKSTLTIMPMILSYLETNTWALLEVLAHEVAHKIGPFISEINGYKVRENYNDILACYSSNDSLALKPGQEDETIADYISGEVIASLVKQLPQDKKINAIYSAHQFSCLAESWRVEDGRNKIEEFNHSHPEMRLRVAGIFGAIPRIREVLACEQESKMFRSCSMEKR